MVADPAEVYVAEDDGDETVDTQYLIQGTFPTKEAAVQAAIISGMRVVDRAIASREIQSVMTSETNFHPRTDMASGALLMTLGKHLAEGWLRFRAGQP